MRTCGPAAVLTQQAGSRTPGEALLRSKVSPPALPLTRAISTCQVVKFQFWLEWARVRRHSWEPANTSGRLQHGPVFLDSGRPLLPLPIEILKQTFHAIPGDRQDCTPFRFERYTREHFGPHILLRQFVEDYVTVLQRRITLPLIKLISPQ